MCSLYVPWQSLHNNCKLCKRTIKLWWCVWQKTGENVTENQLHEILSEVDVNKNAEVDIDEFLLVLLFTRTFLFLLAVGTCLYVYRVSQKKVAPWDFLAFFLKRLGIFQPNFTCLLYVSIYDRLQIFIQLTPILMKLCHNKRDHPVQVVSTKCPPSVMQAFSDVFSEAVWNF